MALGNKVFLFFLMFLLLLSISSAFTLELDEGLNLISVPTNLENKTAGWLCEQADCSLILAYNGEWVSYSPSKPDYLNELAEVNETLGLWIIAGSVSSTEVGDELRTIAIDYTAGWNLVGYPGSEARAVGEVYDLSKIEYVFAFNETWKNVTILEPGFGYWVKAKEDFVLVYNSNNAPVIDSIKILPDDLGDAGVQVMPNADDIKEVILNVEVTDLDGVGDILQVKAQTPKGGISLVKVGNIDSDTANYSGSFYMNYSDAADFYSVIVNASDDSDYHILSADFEYLELIALELDASTLAFGSVDIEETDYLNGDTDILTDTLPTIKNIGNAVIDVDISGTNLTQEGNKILVENMGYRFDDAAYNVMSGVPATVDLNLNSALTNKVDLSLYVPLGTVQGQYEGVMTITAR